MRRPPATPLVTLVLLLALALAPLGLGATSHAPASRAPKAASVLGVASGGGNLQYLSPRERALHLDRMRAAGAVWVRFDMAWTDIQDGGPASYRWGRYDRLVAAITARGMRPLPVLAYTPGWARRADCPDSDKCAPADPATFGRFARRVAERYVPRGVRSYEIWNEPNIHFWLPRPDPEGYAALLRSAYLGIKRVARDTTVISGGLAPFGPIGAADEQSMNPVTFAQRMYAAGAGRYLDALGVHPYNSPHPPTSRADDSAWSQMFATSPSLRSVMRAHGDAGVQMWATEFGYPSCSSGERECVSEDAQSALLRESVRDWRRRSWTGPLLWYDLVDAGQEEDPYNRYGLVRRDFSPKPAFGTFRSLSRPARARTSR